MRLRRDQINSSKNNLSTSSAHMYITRLSHPVKSLFSTSSINQLARETGFLSRLRGMHPLKLVASLCNVLGAKGQANLADIQRELATLSLQAPAYKPFHNQFKKPQLTTFMRRLVSKVTEQLLIAPFVSSLSGAQPFERIHVHDGSTLKLHDGLKDTFAGRFTQTMPAAVELHLTMDLLSGSVDYMEIDADKESERLYQPYANESKGILHLMDAGYFDIGYVFQINEFGGYCIIHAKNNINPTIIKATRGCGTEIRALQGKRLQSLKLKQDEILDLTVSWEGKEGTFRLIASWDKRKRRRGYLITNLPRDTFLPKHILEYYGLRWQVELLFKELKSWCNLSTFATRNADIVRTLIWSSVLVMLLKRFMAFGTAAMCQIVISTQKVQRSAVTWMHHWVQALCGKTDMNEALETIVEILRVNAVRAHPKRDKGRLATKLTLFKPRFSEPKVVNI